MGPAKNAQNCFLYRLLLVVAASTFGFLIDGIETEFLRADCTSEFSRNQDPELNSRTGRLFLGRLTAQSHDAVSAFTGRVN